MRKAEAVLFAWIFLSQIFGQVQARESSRKEDPGSDLKQDTLLQRPARPAMGLHPLAISLAPISRTQAAPNRVCN